ncbi:MAG TPA: bifunctional phosphoglucose/phosphomannose isomerase [Actinomycetota bacterium]
MSVVHLDDRAALQALDAGGMLSAVAALPDHVRDAYASGGAATGLPDLEGVTAVVFCGMGGSAVAGDVLKHAYRDVLRVPVDVNRSPLLPAFAGPDTLVVVSSYSGNTSETLSSFRDAVARGCRIVAVTGGGTLGAECAQHGLPVVPVPGGFQPRAALGHLTFAMLGALEAAGLLPSLAGDVAETVEVLGSIAAALGPEIPAETNAAKAVAQRIGDRVPVVWGADGIGALAAMRWKTQLNENGKLPAWHAAMSELDHNEVVGWTVPYGAGHAVIGLRHDGEVAELQARFPLSAQIALDSGATYEEVQASGHSALARLLSLILVGDYVSCYVGLHRGIDPTPVVVIDRLKSTLAGDA